MRMRSSKRNRGRAVRRSFLACVAFLLAVVCSSCQGGLGLRHVSGEEFLEQAAEIERVHSAYFFEYVGVSRSRVYLECTHVHPSSNGRTVLYWTWLSELPPDLAEELRAGVVPWVSVYEHLQEAIEKTSEEGISDFGMTGQ